MRAFAGFVSSRDTFIVRTIMLPAAVEVIGDKIWWPSDPKGGLRALRGEEAAASEPVTAGARGS